jgi:hypothetical protein
LCKLKQNTQDIRDSIFRIKDWKNFISLSYSHGIFPLVYRGLKNFDDLVPKDILTVMKFKYMDILKQNMLMTSELIKVLKILEENNIEAITFKGPSLSHLAYGDVISRQYVDLDILVEEKNLIKTQDILKKLEYFTKYKLEDYQINNLKNVVHDISFINKLNSINLELHWTLSSGEFFINLEKLNYLQDKKKYIINNNEINIFSTEKLFIYLCVHGYKHLWERIEWLIDIYYLLEKNNLDIRKIIEMSKLIDADRIVLSTLIICNKIFDLEIKLDNSLLQNKRLNKFTDNMIGKIFDNYLVVSEKNHSKQLSMIQLYFLKTKDNRLKYLKTLFKPTEKDYEKIKISSKFHFIYYLLRPFNIFSKSVSQKFNKNK